MLHFINGLCFALRHLIKMWESCLFDKRNEFEHHKETGECAISCAHISKHSFDGKLEHNVYGFGFWNLSHLYKIKKKQRQMLGAQKYGI